MSRGRKQQLLTLFLIDFILPALFPALGRCIHLSARLPRLDWRCGGWSARSPIVGLRIKQILYFGVFDVGRRFEQQSCGGMGVTGKGEKGERTEGNAGTQQTMSHFYLPCCFELLMQTDRDKEGAGRNKWQCRFKSHSERLHQTLHVC